MLKKTRVQSAHDVSSARVIFQFMWLFFCPRKSNYCHYDALAQVLRHSSPATARWLPLMLSFAVHPDYQEVGVPDPSFWSWPEMGVPPHWQLLKDPDIVAWHKKASTAFWRGGSNRRFAEKTRKALLGCPSSAPEALQVRCNRGTTAHGE